LGGPISALIGGCTYGITVKETMGTEREENEPAEEGGVTERGASGTAEGDCSKREEEEEESRDICTGRAEPCTDADAGRRSSAPEASVKK
jgi:hypothetical protein